jgi:subtilisin family serine protease
MRKKLILTSLLILSVILAFGVIAKSAAQGRGVGHEDVLIGFKAFPGKSEKAIVEKAGGKIKYAYRLIQVIAASVPSAAIKGLKHNPNVTYVEEDGDIFLNDELTDNWGVIHIGADQAWDINKGAGVHVSIIDTGIDKDHPDLVANIAGGVNFVSGKGKNKSRDPVAWDDGHGHGTHCAGIVAADDNGFGVVGVAPDLRFDFGGETGIVGGLYGVKVLDDRGRGKASDFIAGLEWSVYGPDGILGNEDDAEIISISLTMWDPIDGSVTAACDAAYDEGLLLVAAAGNTSGGGVVSPAGHPSVIAVSAIDATNNIAWFSADGREVELTAPGVGIYSTYRNGGYTSMDGTSMACPHVAGVAALAWATEYYVNGSAVRFQLNRTAEPLGTLPLPNEQYGYGLVDALAAVALPDPAFNVEVREDNGAYLEGPEAQVILTVVLKDEFGDPVTDIESVVFGATLIDYFDPFIEIERPDFTIAPTGIDGIYTGSFSISDLDVEEDVRYRVVVTAEDSNVNRFGSGEDSFFIQAITGELLLVDIQTDKPIYTMGERIYTTVTVKNGSGDPVDDVWIYTRVITASGIHHNDEKYTDVDGVAKFDTKTKKPDGKGIWRISSNAKKSGYMDGWSAKYIEVK